MNWHADVTPASKQRPKLPDVSALSVCLLGSDSQRVAASKGSLGSQSRPPAEVVVAEEAAAAQPSGDLILFMPAGSRLADGAIEALERVAAFSGAEVIAVAVRTGVGGETRVPVGGPAIGGLLRRCFGDAAFLIRREALARLGGFDSETEPGDQCHQLLCRAAIAGIAIEIFCEPVVTDVPQDALGEMSIVQRAHRRTGVIDAFRNAPIEMLRELPLLTQQLYSIGIEREAEFDHLYANRFGRLTLPLRRSAIRARRARQRFKRRSRP